jgi:fluoride ion exporter CrcB/FEX
MELAATARGCGMMTPARSATGNSAVNDILVISVGTILGANARWLISTYLARTLGPVFPYGTLLINIVGSFVVGFNHGVDNPNGWRSILAGACWGGWLLRVVHYVF